MANQSLKLINLVGARPQFIKAAAVSNAIRVWNQDAANSLPIEEIVVHTGQHYDHNMSAVFFEQMRIPKEHYNLQVNGGNHAQMTARMMLELDPILATEQPDWLVVYGDTNSTLAAALVAAKRQIPIAHIEAGLRSFNVQMPEELNRKLTDHLSQVLCVPTQAAKDNLRAEGINQGVHQVGDVMQDALSHYRPIAANHSEVLSDLKLTSGQYSLCTLHRDGNVSQPEPLSQATECINWLSQQTQVVMPLHPRTRNNLQAFGLSLAPEVMVIEPVSYLDMLSLLDNAQAIVTDSGGLQKEAYMLKTPCITMREDSEWVETIASGWNQLVGINLAALQQAWASLQVPNDRPQYYGEGDAAVKILELLARYTKKPQAAADS